MGVSLAAAGVVMAVMTGFMVLAIRQISIALHRELKEDVAQVLGVYDHLIEEKSMELKELNQRIDGTGKRPAAGAEQNRPGEPVGGLGSNPVSGMGLLAGKSYRDDSFVENYHLVHDGFQADYEDIIKRVAENCRRQPKSHAGKLLSEIPFETFCSLSLLSHEKQEAVLCESLPEEGKKLFYEYRSLSGQVDSVDFYSFLKRKARDENEGIIIRTGGAVELGALPDGVFVEKEASICEGIQIFDGKTLYDYSISERDIS